MDREKLSLMTKEEANRSLSYEDKVKWVEEHTKTANTYFMRNGEICDVEPAGWWY
jgi:hypothetical protein